MFIVHGDADPRAPINMSRDFSQHLRNLGIKHEYHEIEGGTHSLSESRPLVAKKIRQKQLAFIKKYSR